MTDPAGLRDRAVPRGAPRTAARRGRPGHVAIAMTVALLGFLFATQLRVEEGIGERLAIEREEDLARILADLSSRSDQLLEEIVDLRVQLAEAAGSAEQEEVLIRNARGELEAIQVLLGTVPVQGEGIAVTIADPASAVGPEAIVDVLQELRDAGAEAIEVNRVRVVASTALGGPAGDLRIGGRPIRAPYRIFAIGGASTLAEAMRIPGGVVDSISSRDGAAIDIGRRSRIRIASLQALPRFTYARPSERR